MQPSKSSNQDYQFPVGEYNNSPDSVAPIDTASRVAPGQLNPEVFMTSESAVIHDIQNDIEVVRQAKLTEQPQEIDIHPLMRVLRVLVSTIPTQKLTHADLVERESRVGGRSLGEAPIGMERQFCFVDDNDWIFISTVSIDGKLQKAVTRYEVRAEGVLKSNDGKGHSLLTGEELQNFVNACKRYQSAVLSDIYGQTTKSQYDLAA